VRIETNIAAGLPVRNPAPLRPPTPKKDDTFWRELRHDVRDYILHFDHERIDDFSRVFKSMGGVLKDGWKIVRDIPRKILNHPIIIDKVDKDDRDFWSDLGGQVGMVAGFAAAGGHAMAGALKVTSGVKQGNWGRGLDGLVDIASGTSLALAVAGLTGARLVVAPIAATINMIRGGYNAAQGFRRGDSRKQLQGTLDVTRSAGSFGRLLRKHSPVFGVMGVALAPVAGALQAGRGLHDMATGIKNDDNRKKIKGLVDVATAVGTALAFASGPAVIPGIALAVAANLVKVGYQLSPKFRKKVDKVLDQHEDKLKTMVDKSEQFSAPVVNAYKKFMARFIKKLDPTGPDRFSKAQLSEVVNLLHCDGRYSREEYERLRTDLEQVGQKKDLPKRSSEPPALRRPELVAELKTPEERADFVRFLLVVADYDYQNKPEETAFLRQLATGDLGMSEAQFLKLLNERLSENLALQKAGFSSLAIPAVDIPPADMSYVLV
jgi:hypothetical protein